MGYPMNYQRVVSRNRLDGDYVSGATSPVVSSSLIAGDLRRLEMDQRDQAHLIGYAECAGITPEQAKAVLDAFFAGNVRWSRPSARVDVRSGPEEMQP